MKKICSILFVLLMFMNMCFASSDTYVLKNKYHQKVATYKTNGNKTVEYNRYGQKTATYKQNSNGTVTKYNRYGQKVGTIKKK